MRNYKTWLALAALVLLVATFCYFQPVWAQADMSWNAR